MSRFDERGKIAPVSQSQEMTSGPAAVYRSVVLGHPKLVITLLILVLAFFAFHAQSFRLDASADSLLLETDQDLLRFREIQERYRTQDLLVVTFTPGVELFSDLTLARLARLRDELRAVGGISSVTTILDVPLLESSDVPVAEMAENVQSLETPGVDRAAAREEIHNSPIYRNLLLSDDGQTTALLLSMEEDAEFQRLQASRTDLVTQRAFGQLDESGAARLEALTPAYERAHLALGARRRAEVAAIRDILARYREDTVVHLGGVPMITNDMVAFIKHDLIVFGAGVLVFMLVVLTVIFRRLRWTVLPLLSCFYSGLTMIGVLGLLGWKVTVISSNFLALMLIITISMNIHLAVRYRQLSRDQPGANHLDLLATTVQRMVWPCLYTALTTIIGFSSLVFSGIKPVIDFGWMMSIGLGVTFVTSFMLFPCLLTLLSKTDEGDASRQEFRFTASIAHFTDRHGGVVLAAAVGLAITSAFGISRLTVENSFIDYFSKRTEIYQGMKLIDEQLGGTTPLEIILDLDEARIFGEDDDDLEEDYEDDYADEYANDPAYWFTTFKVNRIKQVHDYLDALPEVGKVLSLASTIRVGERLNEGRELDSFQLALLYKRIPLQLRESLIDPYISIANNEARVFLRVRDSLPDLRRKELLERIEVGLATDLELSEQDVTVSGLLVLYNNMLQSLYQSQIATLGAVLAGVGVMLLVLFRSVSLAIIGLVPNLLAATTVLGMMGLLDIPLDMMTITVAAITIGIAVDNAIHYIYRFREEFPNTGDYVETLHVCHANIGRAVFYTSCTIIFGFSILVLSNFLPTIYFGLLTALAMLIALLAALTLLPKLILMWKPF